MATPNIVPRADSEGGIGTASKYWASAYIDTIIVGAGSIGRDADNNIDFSIDDRIQFEVAGAIRTKMDSNRFYPQTNDQISLGISGNAWSDLFLASGAVINFDDGNVTLTHSSGALTLADNQKFNFGSGNDLQIKHTGSGGFITNVLGDLTISTSSDGGDIKFFSDDGGGGTANYITIDGGGVLTRVHKKLRADDNVNIELGASGGMHLKHTGSASNITNHVGDLTIQNDTNDGDIIFQASTGSATAATYLTLDGSVGRTKFDKHLQANDTVKIFLGTGLDFEMYHNASNTLLQNNAGDLGIINMKQNKDILFQADDGQASDDTVATYFYLDGSSAEHNGSATTALYTNWPDNSRISVGTSHDLQLDHNSTDSIIRNETGDLYIMNKADDKDVIFQASTGSAAAETYFYLDGSIGANRFPKNVLWDDNVKALFGGGSGDLQIYHDGSHSIIDNNTGDLKIICDSDDIKILAADDVVIRDHDDSTEMAKFINGGAVELYHNGSKKLATKSDGVDITGELQADSLDIDGNADITGTLTINGTNTFLIESNSTAATFNLNSGARGFDFINNNATLLSLSSAGNATFAGDVTINGSHLTLANGTTSAQSTDYLYIGGGNLASADAAIYIGNQGAGGGYGYRIYYEGTGSGNNNKLIFKSENLGSNVDMLSFTADGNATFAGAISVGGHAVNDILIAGDTFANDDDHLMTAAAIEDKILSYGYGTGGGSGNGDMLLGTAQDITADKEYQDGVKAKFGAGGDLEIFHNGTNNFIENYAGTLFITQHADDGDIIFRSDDGSGGVEAYFFLDGSTGHTQFPDAKKLQFGSSNDMFIEHDGSNSYISSNVGTFYIRQTLNDGDLVLTCDDGSGGNTAYITLDGGDEIVRVHKPLWIADYITHIGDTNTFFGFSAADTFVVHAGASGHAELTITGTTATFAGKLEINQAGTGTSNVPSAVAEFSGQAAGGVLKALSLVNSVTAASGNGTQLAFHNASNYSPTGTITTIQAGDVTEDSKMEFQIYNSGLQTALTINHESNATFAGSVTATGGLIVDGQFTYDTDTGNQPFYITRSGSTNQALSIKVMDDNVRFESIQDESADNYGGFEFNMDGGTTEPDFTIRKSGGSNLFNVRGDGNATFAGSVSASEVILGQNKLDGSSDNFKIHADSGNVSGNSTIEFYIDGAEKAVINSSGDADFSGNVILNSRLTFDYGGDHYLEAGTDTWNFKSASGTTALQLNHSTQAATFGGDVTINASLDIIRNSNNDQLKLKRNGSATGEFDIYTNTNTLFFKNVATSQIPLGIDGSNNATFAGSVHLNSDSAQLQLGDDNDMQIFHNGANGEISNGTGDLIIEQNVDDGDIIFKCDNGSGGVTEYFRLDGSSVFNVFNKQIYLPDNVTTTFGDGSDLSIHHNGSNSYITQQGTGDLYLMNTTDDKDIKFLSDDGSGGTAEYLRVDGGGGYIVASKDILVAVDNKAIKLGASQDLQIYHDGSNSFVAETGTGGLFVEANSEMRFRKQGTTEIMAQFLADGECRLYHNNVKKFETAAAGTKTTFAATSNTDGDAAGDIVNLGETTTVAGKIYYYTSSGAWELADADAESTAKGMLGVALGTSSGANGMLLRGMVTLDHDPGTIADTLFLSTTAGAATATAPSGTGDIVRVIGYSLNSTNGQIYFNPDGAFVEVTAG